MPDMFSIILMMVIIGFIVGSYFLIKISINSSQKFWNKSREIKKKLGHVNTFDELKVLYETDFQELIKLSGGEVQQGELKYIDGLFMGIGQVLKNIPNENKPTG